MFKIGDRVRCTGGNWYRDVGDIPGIVVIITKERDFDTIGILFDEELPDYNGHSLSGYLEGDDVGKGYWIDETDLELLKKSNIGNY